MKRREFLHTAAAGIGSIEAASRLRVPVGIGRSPDVVVVGAGAFGGWTALYLAKMGANVTLVDAYGPGNSRSSSGGESRLMQVDAGDRPIYAHLALRAYQRWLEWQDAWGEEIIFPTGRLVLRPEELRSQAVQRKRAMEEVGVTDVELVEVDELRRRWPQIDYEGLTVGLYNPGGAGGSTLMARRCCQRVLEELTRMGGTFRIGHARPGRAAGGRLASATLSQAESLSAQTYVFACGPWLPKIFPELLGKRLQVQRRDMVFIGTPPGDDSFRFPRLPSWSFTGTGFYGFPEIRGHGVKFARYPDYNALDPDTDERVVNPYEVKRAYDFAALRFPALRGQPAIDTRVCQVTNSVDSHFIVDTHPELANVWIMGGGSGIGFKHGPALGEYAAKRILGEGGEPEWDRTFRLKEEMF